MVLTKGRITEIGNHDSLLRDHPTGVYANLVRSQQDAEDDDLDEIDLEMQDLDIDESAAPHNTSYVINKERKTIKEAKVQEENDEGFDDLMKEKVILTKQSSSKKVGRSSKMGRKASDV